MSVCWQDYNVIHSEDENFSVTATVISLEPGLDQLVEPQPVLQEVSVNNLGQDVSVPPPGTGEPEKRKRSRTVPSRFKDYDTVSPYKRTK